MRVTCDALAVEKPIWMLGDSAYDTLGWHDHLLAAGVVPVAFRTTHETPTIRKTSSTGSKPASTNTARTFAKVQSTLDETTYNRRSGVERTNDAVRTAASGTFAPEAASHARARVFLALCLRLVIAITNDERGAFNPGSTVITL